MTTLQHLLKIRSYVTRTFWSKGYIRQRTPDGPHKFTYCLLGLAAHTGKILPARGLSPTDEVRDDLQWYFPLTMKALNKAVYDTVGGDHDDIADFNDAFSTTRADVLQLLNYAIEDTKKGMHSA